MARNMSMSGFTLIEVMVTLFVVALGLLGMNALQSHTVNNAFESYQRALMSSVVEDMSARIRMNPIRAKAGAYFVTPTMVVNCDTLSGSERDLCEWYRELDGRHVIDENGAPVASPFGAVGCIENLGGNVIRVSVAWLGQTSQVVATTDCGQGVIAPEDQRRVVYRDVTIA